jgi:1-acyl-sn-glycerol-3-phosphate acyltransferase
VPHRRGGFWYWFGLIPLETFTRVVATSDYRGLDRLPRTGGLVLAVNHISHIDPVTVALFVNRQGRLPRFLAKDTLFKVPLVRSVLLATGQVPVYRGSADAGRAYTAAVAAVSDGDVVVVYPEGTLTRDARLWPMTGKTGAAHIALTADVPVIPVAHWGSQALLRPYGRLVRPFPRKRVTVLVGDPVDLDDLRGRPITAEVLREATARIMAVITALLVELRGGSAPQDLVHPEREPGLDRLVHPPPEHYDPDVVRDGSAAPPSS